MMADLQIITAMDQLKYQSKLEALKMPMAMRKVIMNSLNRGIPSAGDFLSRSLILSLILLDRIILAARTATLGMIMDWKI
jgi:hypothetical protein